MAYPDKNTFGTIGGTIAYTTKRSSDDFHIDVYGSIGSFQTYETGIEIEAFHADVFFDTDGQAMERADRFLVLSIVLVKFCCAC